MRDGFQNWQSIHRKGDTGIGCSSIIVYVHVMLRFSVRCSLDVAIFAVSVWLLNACYRLFIGLLVKDRFARNSQPSRQILLIAIQ